MIGMIILLGNAIGMLMMAWAIGVPPATRSDIWFARCLCGLVMIQSIILMGVGVMRA